MFAADNKPIELRDPGEVIAAIPALLRFTPSDSVVLIALSDASVVTAIRLDLPNSEDDTTLVDEIRHVLVRHSYIAQLVTVIVCEAMNNCSLRLPYHAFVTALEQMAGNLGAAAGPALCVDRIQCGRTWRCYHDPRRVGTVPDPTASLIAAHSAAAGEVIYASLDDLADQIAADTQPDLDRRAGLLRGLPAVRPVDAVALLRDTVHRIGVSDPTIASVADLISDEVLVRLAHALTHPAVRDFCFQFALGEQAAHAERLWVLLTRATPRPEAAHPAVLLTISAYLRGDGVLARAAVDAALSADPHDSLAELLRTVLDHGLPPDQLRQLLMESVRRSAADTTATPESANPRRDETRTP